MIVVRPYQPTDLGQVLDLWERTGSTPTGPDGLTVDQAIDLMASEHAVTVVAEADGRVIGMALGLVASVVGWLCRIVVLPDEASVPETAARLLDVLEPRFAEYPARKIVTVVSESGPIRASLDRRGYLLRSDERVEHDFPDLLRGAAGDRKLGSPLQRLLT